MMFGLIIERLHFGKGIVAVIGLRVWLPWNWFVGIFAQQRFAAMISET